MGNVYQDQGKLDLALEYYAKALEISIAAVGEQHSDVGTTYNNMAAVYQDQGKLDLALEYYAKALEIYSAAVGEQHSSVGGTYNNMGNVSIPRQTRVGFKYYAKALEMCIAALESIRCWTNKTNRFSFGVLREGLEIEIAALGEKHSDVGTHTTIWAKYIDSKANSIWLWSITRRLWRFILRLWGEASQCWRYIREYGDITRK